MADTDTGTAAVADARIVIPATFPSWAPTHVVEWLRITGSKAPARMASCFVALVCDTRMREVWNWHAATTSPDGFGFCFAIHGSRRMPSFPGSLTAAKRGEYLANVRKHATALADLLAPTEYGRNCASVAGFETKEIDDARLAETVERDLAKWGEDETGHVVAYYVDEDGVSRLPWDYPESSLCDLLWDVVGWTQMDDYWDLMRSSRPIENAKGANRHITYFVRTLYDRLARQGITIPFAHLATVANVALALPAGAEVDEDAVRKQVRRYKGNQDITFINDSAPY